MLSFSVIFFWALIQQANGEACESGDWSVLLVRSGANEAHCTSDIDMVIDAQMEACVKDGSDGKINRSGHHRRGDTRRLLANPEPRKLLRTTPLLQQDRELLACDSCGSCHSMICRVLAAGGAAPYCSDSCEGRNCSCQRRLKFGDNQDGQLRNLEEDSSSDEASRSRGWYERRMTRRCKWVIKACAEALIQDNGNYCLGDPELLEVAAHCVA